MTTSHILQAGVLQRGTARTRRRAPHSGLLDRVGLEVRRRPADEHHLVVAAEQLLGDGPADGPGARDRDPFASVTLFLAGAWPAAAVISVMVSGQGGDVDQVAVLHDGLGFRAACRCRTG